MRTSESSPEKVSKGGALPLRVEPGTCIACTGKVCLDDGSVDGVVTANWLHHLRWRAVLLQETMVKMERWLVL